MNNTNLVQNLKQEIQSKLKKESSQFKVFDLLSDQKWHCRSCEGKMIASEQYAGGGGIQGLQRGTKSRPGLVIKTKKENCQKCKKITTWDQWTGGYEGNENWSSPHQRGAEAEEGCIGCGWYDFEAWRKTLNKKLSQSELND